MDPGVVVAVIGGVLSLTGVWLANRFTSRTAREAQITTAQIESRKLDIQTWKEQVELWRGDALKMRERMNEFERESREHRDECRRQIQDLEEAIEREQDARVEERVQLDALMAWAKVVVGILRSGKIPYPVPPPGVDDSGRERRRRARRYEEEGEQDDDTAVR
jgi:septal ring factor EnvC (AmiA/AmiB activator)